MTVHRVVAIAAFLIASALPLRAQTVAGPSRSIDPVDGVTLEQAIAEALRSEPAMQAARSEIDVARGDRRQAGRPPNPSVSLERREQAGGTDNQTTLGVELPLDWYRRRARTAVADREIEVATQSVEDHQRLLAGAVRRTYGEVLVAVRRVEVLDALVDATRQTRELLDAKVSSGAAPPLERDLALVDLYRLRAEREVASGAVEMAMAELKRLLGRPPQDALRLRTSLEALVMTRAPLAADAASNAAPPARADIQEASAMVARAGARIRLANIERRPELGLFGSYMRMDNGFPQQGTNAQGQLEPVHAIFDNVAAGVRLSVPIFNRGQGAVAAALAERTAAERQLDARRLAAGAELFAAQARDEAAGRALAIYSTDVRALARRNLDVVRETYQLGRATLFEVLNETRRYLDFETAFTSTLMEAFASRAALQQARGDIR